MPIGRDYWPRCARQSQFNYLNVPEYVIQSHPNSCTSEEREIGKKLQLSRETVWTELVRRCMISINNAPQCLNGNRVTQGHDYIINES